MAQELRFFSAKSVLYYGKKRNKNITFKKGNKIYLLRKNIKIIKLNSKLNYVKIGPFKILKNIKGISFKFNLPNIIKIYLVFYASLLEPADNATLITIIKPGYIDFQEKWEVEEVLNE